MYNRYTRFCSLLVLQDFTPNSPLDTPNTPNELADMQQAICPDCGASVMPQKVVDAFKETFKTLKTPEDHSYLAILVLRHLSSYTNCVLEDIYADENISRDDVMSLAAPFMQDLARYEAADELITLTIDDCCSEDA